MQLRHHALGESTIRVAQAMADVATTGLLQQALQVRVLIEQAKRVLAERLSIGISQALRRYSRSLHQHLSAVAEAVVAGRIDVDALGAERREPT
jgi:hypothetical protein